MNPWAILLRIREMETDAEIERIAGRDVTQIHEAIERLYRALAAVRQ
jgi:hypothetical protein